MNIAIDFIEENLLEPVDVKKLSSATGQTAVSFLRTFSIITNTSVHEYIRKRRMTLAAFELQDSSVKVIDIALKYGYESPEAFSRAFKEIHGVSPSCAKCEGIELKSFPRLTFILTVQGVEAMDYRIEKKEAFSVYGIEKIFSCDNGNKEVPEFFHECNRNNSIERLTKSVDWNGSLCNICDYKETDDETFYYMIAVQAAQCASKEFKRIDIPAATWAVFKTKKYNGNEKTADVFQTMIKRIYTDWLPTANYKKQEGCELDMIIFYANGTRRDEKWIRVEQK